MTLLMSSSYFPQNLMPRSDVQQKISKNVLKSGILTKINLKYYITSWKKLGLSINFCFLIIFLCGKRTCRSTVMMKNSMEKHRMYPEWRPCQMVKKNSVATWDKVLFPRNFNRLNTCLKKGKSQNHKSPFWS